MIKVKVLYQVYREKERNWETYEKDEKKYYTDSVKEAFFKYCEDRKLVNTFVERAWRNRKKTQNAVYLDTSKGTIQVGFSASMGREWDGGRSYLSRAIFEFSRFNENYDDLFNDK